MTTNYLFTSERLGFRTWQQSDLNDFTLLNSDKEVMAHFPKTLTPQDTKTFMKKLQQQYHDKDYTYFAVDTLKNQEFIGFIGLGYQDYDTDFTPNIDIGWRLKKTAWGKGYATEGAKRCLGYAFNSLKINTIIAICTVNNTSSEHVMKKIGMIKKGTFKHPLLKNYPNHESCVCYEIQNFKNPI